MPHLPFNQFVVTARTVDDDGTKYRTPRTVNNIRVEKRNVFSTKMFQHVHTIYFPSNK